MFYGALGGPEERDEELEALRQRVRELEAQLDPEALTAAYMAGALDLKMAVRALQDIIGQDQREVSRMVKFDPAGSDYEVDVVDGPCARIARGVLLAMNQPVSEPAKED